MKAKLKKKSSSSKNKAGVRTGSRFSHLSILITLAIIILAIIVIAVIWQNVTMRNYDGMGDSKTLTYHDYDLSSFYMSNGMRYYEDSTYESAIGIDVSEYQGEIDWEAVKACGIDFAMIRVGYRAYSDGMIYLDEYFEQNIKAARKAGIQVGVYFYSQATTEEEAIDEAVFVIKHIKHQNITYPVAFDMEWDDGDRISELTVEERTKIADAFCSVIENNGYNAIIYGNPTWLEDYIDLSYLTEYDTWLANYGDTTYYPYQFTMWQYSNTGTLDGISTSVDMNVYIYKK